MTSAIDYKKELTDFVKIISHDLRGPIRHIKSFHNILMADIRLNDEQQELKGYMDDAIDHLESQLEGILTLSRLNTSELDITEVNLKSLFEEITESLNEQIIKSDFFLSVPAELNVITDRSRVYRACFEVITIALKFHQPDNPAQVSVTAIIDKGSVKVTVLDKGIGIDEKHFQDIYQAFRCLNYQESYVGSCIGLTLSQKALYSIEGSIDVEKNGEQGCQFTITLPLQLKL